MSDETIWAGKPNAIGKPDKEYKPEPMLKPAAIYSTRFFDGKNEIFLKLTGDEYAVMHRWMNRLKAEVWDEVAAIVENCHDCLTYSGVKNPYRNN